MMHRAHAAAFVGLVFVVSPVDASRAQMGHGHHPPIAQQQLILEVRHGLASQTTALRETLPIADASVAQTVDHVIEVSDTLPPVHVREYLPSAKLTQALRPDPAGAAPAATLVSIEGPEQTVIRWLVADDPQRNRLISLIGTWRIMTVANKAQRDRLYYEFETEYLRAPMLHVSARGDAEPTSIIAEPGTIHELPALGGRLSVLDFYTHYAVSNETGAPVNQSAKRVNPAVRVKLERDGITEKRWVFAQFPDYTTGEPAVIPWTLTLDCPAEGKSPRPDVAVVLTRPEDWEIWLRHAGKTRSEHAVEGQPVDLPASQYQFRLRSMVPSGRLVERYVATEEKDGVQAVRIETAAPDDQPTTIWLTPGKPHILTRPSGPVTFTLQTSVQTGGGHP